ncbi:MAG: hypothetical protein ACLQPH_19150, partial [Acidimicrobiales bacterium]
LWGSRLVRWAAIKAVARYHGGNAFTEQFHVIAKRRGRTRANVAIARKVLTLGYYGLRDGEIRSLAEAPAACRSDTPDAGSQSGKPSSSSRWRGRLD